ncbi:phage major capsid protein [Nocardioides sp. GY 10113]|uniref:phage major capsid protein n=1 Tax=Nocardioides sp. GY 10113 TaxID=2569761 RepID=UPI0010A88243|nr:phage major capsid protein [Nocardioides sp. GY 10113]TIC83864.1 phage major capsid protein [Nocardioides sp. GY 10113]
MPRPSRPPRAGGRRDPFADSLTRYDTGNSRAVFGVIDSLTGAAWINEADAKPDVSASVSSYVAVAQELAGIPLVSERAVRDTKVNLLAEVQRVLRLYFGRVLDDGLLHGNGTAPNPTGVFSFAEEATGTDLWSSVHAAKAAIVTAGGSPTTVALPPSAIVAEEARLDAQNRPLYDGALTAYAGLEVVAVPAMAADEGLVYDKSGCYLIVAEDFVVTPSRDYAPAYQRDSVALRTSGQFTVGVPVPDASIRALSGVQGAAFSSAYGLGYDSESGSPATQKAPATRKK